MTPIERSQAILTRLLERTPDGQPDPISLTDLRVMCGEGEAARQRLDRILRSLGQHYTICRHAIGTAGPGRPPAEAVMVWALLPGEALIV